ESLLTAVEDLYETLRDEVLRAQSEAWTTATVTYGVLRKASEVTPSLRTEIASARKWFRSTSGRKATRGIDPVAPTAPTDTPSASTDGGGATASSGTTTPQEA